MTCFRIGEHSGLHISDLPDLHPRILQEVYWFLARSKGAEVEAPRGYRDRELTGLQCGAQCRSDAQE